MSPAWTIVSIAVAGAVGGLLNGLQSDNGLTLSRIERFPNGTQIWRPGFIGNTIVGMVVALVLTAVYTPLGELLVAAEGAKSYPMTLRLLAGAVVSGIGGSRLLTAEVDKRYEQLTRRQLSTTIEELLGKE